MNDPFFVGCSEAMSDLQSIVQSLTCHDRSGPQALPERLSLEQFRHYVGRAFARANIEYCQNIRMVQGSGSKSLLLKTAEPVGGKRKGRRQNLDRHFTFQARITGTINFAHSARAQQGN